MLEDTNKQIHWFRESAPYINANRGKTFVLMLSGEALASTHFQRTIYDIALLSSLGVKLIIVFGARPQIQAQIHDQGLTSDFYQHLRITDTKALDCVINAVGTLRTHIEARLTMGLPNSPMHGARLKIQSGNYVTAKPIGIKDGIDLCHTGEVRRIDCDAIRQQLKSDAIVLLPPLGYSLTGEVFNLSAEDLASQTAVSLNADKLIFMGPQATAIDEDGQLLRELSTHEAAWIIAAGLQSAEVTRYLNAACDACNAGILRAHLVSSDIDGALLNELYTRDGSGTLVMVKSFEQIRPAHITDVGGIIQLIQPLEETHVLVRRSRELLETEIEQFTVIERDGAIIGCAAAYPFPEEQTIELACIAVAPEYQGSGRGDQLADEICAKAKAAGMKRVVVLSTQTAHWFLERGFQKADVAALPASKQSLYNWQRNSSVFEKTL